MGTIYNPFTGQFVPSTGIPPSTAGQPNGVATLDNTGKVPASQLPPGTTASYVDIFTLTGTDITNKFVTLSSTPGNTTKVMMNIIGGIIQENSVDYSVITNVLSWNGLGLDGVLQSGDKLIVIYN